MQAGQKQRGFSLMELIVGLSIMLMALYLFVPNGKGTKDVVTTQTAAEELVARFREARQVAVTKGVPVAVAFPRTASSFHTDVGFRLEGETSPQVTTHWKIQQTRTNVSYFTGQWQGPVWANAPVLVTASKAFDPKPSVWFDTATPPMAAMYVFTPSGNAVSTEKAADGKFRMIVGMGIGPGSTLSAVNSPYTVWIDPSGEVGFERGVYNGPTVASTTSKESFLMAAFVPPAASANVAPVVLPVSPSTTPGAVVYPNNINPKTNNNMVDLDQVLTVEVRVRDNNGDPPYFKWSTTEVGELQGDGSFIPKADLVAWGGRFGNVNEVRMEWDAESKEWVGRDTWAPSTKDNGGNRYRLTCKIVDHKGGATVADFPVAGGRYLVTTQQPWVLYQTWNAAGVVELWKMSLDGLQHTPLVQFGYQDVQFGQWSPSGAEVIAGAPDGVYRVTANGENIQLVSSVVFPGGIDGCCISPQGDAVYYLGGPTEGKRIRKVYINGTGQPADVPLNIDTDNDDAKAYGGGGSDGVDDVWDLSSALFGKSPGPEKVVLLHTMYHYNKKSWKLFGKWKTERKYRYGAMAVDAGTGDTTPWQTTTTKAGNAGGSTDNSMNFAQVNTVPYGVSFYNTDVPQAGGTTETHILYGDAAGNINIKKVNADFTGTSSITAFKPVAAPILVLPTGRPDTHHPKYAHQDRKSLVFAAGRGTASKIYYMPDITKPKQNQELPVPAGVNNGAEAPSVSRKRY